MLNPNFVLVGVVLLFFGGLSYLVDTVRGKVRPNKVSWMMWSIAPLIAFAAEVKQGVGITSLATFIAGFMPLLIFIASFVNKKAQWKLTRFDLICGMLSVIGLILWMMTKIGNVAILFSILADGIAYLPTIFKSYRYPETESSIPYLLTSVNAGIALLTIVSWSFQQFGFPLYLLFINLIPFFLIQFKLGKKTVV